MFMFKVNTWVFCTCITNFEDVLLIVKELHIQILRSWYPNAKESTLYVQQQPYQNKGSMFSLHNLLSDSIFVIFMF